MIPIHPVPSSIYAAIMTLATLCGVQAPPHKDFISFTTLSRTVQCALTGSLYVAGLMLSLHQPRTQAHTLPMLNKDTTGRINNTTIAK